MQDGNEQSGFYLFDLFVLLSLRVVFIAECRSFSVGELEDLVENVIESHLFLVGVKGLRGQTIAVHDFENEKSDRGTRRRWNTEHGVVIAELNMDSWFDSRVICFQILSIDDTTMRLDLLTDSIGQFAFVECTRTFRGNRRKSSTKTWSKDCVTEAVDLIRITLEKHSPKRTSESPWNVNCRDLFLITALIYLRIIYLCSLVLWMLMPF